MLDRNDIDDIELSLSAALRSVTDYLDMLLTEGKFPAAGRRIDDRDATAGWWDDRTSAVKKAKELLATLKLEA